MLGEPRYSTGAGLVVPYFNPCVASVRAVEDFAVDGLKNVLQGVTFTCQVGPELGKAENVRNHDRVVA